MPTNRILAGIGHFGDYYAQNEALFRRLAIEGQSPRVLWIGCSDSRVVPEIITGADPGELFVVRNVGNVIPPYGIGQTSSGAAIEYAIQHLHVPHAVICGHTDCAGINALNHPLDLSREPHLARWVEHARPAATKVEASGLPVEEQHLATVRENVLLQVEHLRSYDPVRAAERNSALTIHGWVYHLETGKIERYDPEARSWVVLNATV